MKTFDQLSTDVNSIFDKAWTRRTSTTVPETDDVKLGNDGIEISGTVLYADLADSTKLVTGYKDWFAAAVFKAFLVTGCNLIRNNGGQITAFDGDRVMGVFVGSGQNSAAAKCALQLTYMVREVINPKIKAVWPSTSYTLAHGVGIDTSNLLVVRGGVRGANDLLWVGKAANYAAKLCSLREGYNSSFITERVFNQLNESVKYGGDPKRLMWERFFWAESNEFAYRSTWHWKP